MRVYQLFDICSLHTPLISPIINRGNTFSEKKIEGLMKLGVVTTVQYDAVERNDNGQYTCTATNSLPGGETRELRAKPTTIPLIVLG